MSTKLFRIFSTIILAVVAAVHFGMYNDNMLSGWDLFTCTIGYLSIWGILMMLQFKDDVDI